jgi:hypothetical protein
MEAICSSKISGSLQITMQKLILISAFLKYDYFLQAVKNLNPTLKTQMFNLCFLHDYMSYTPENMAVNIPIKINVFKQNCAR